MKDYKNVLREYKKLGCPKDKDTVKRLAVKHGHFKNGSKFKGEGLLWDINCMEQAVNGKLYFAEDIKTPIATRLNGLLHDARFATYAVEAGVINHTEYRKAMLTLMEGSVKLAKKGLK